MTVFDDARGLLATATAAVYDAYDHASANPPLTGSPYAGGLGVAASALGVAASALGSAATALAALEPKPLMPLLSGLFAEGMSTPSPDVHNYVCNAKWSELQAVAGGPLIHPNPIDKAIASGKAFHVRPHFGRYSPTFALNLPSVQMTDTQDAITAKVPRWWHSDVQTLHADVVAKLAAEYDGKISLIFVSTPMAIYAEPMIRQVGDTATRTALHAVGFTFDLDQAAFRLALDWYSAFKSTRLGIAVNPWQAVKLDGTAWSSVAATNLFIDQYRARFGQQAHVQNNSARTPPLPSYAGMYDHLKGIKPSGYQTATEPRVGSYPQTIQWAIDQGAHLCELSPGYEKHLTSTQLRAYDAALKANAT